MKFSEFCVGFLSESSAVSFGRVASFLSLAFCLGFDTAYVWFAMTHLDWTHMTIGDVLPSGTALLAQAAFCSSFYGLTKAKSSLDNAINNRPENGPK